MDNLQEAIKKRISELGAMREKISSFLQGVPEGKLRIAHNRKNVQYYNCKVIGDTKGSYIRKADRKLANALAQADYAEKMLREVNKEIASLQKFDIGYDGYALYEIYESMSDDRKELVKPFLLTDSEYKERWQSMHIGKRSERTDEDAIYTENGEIVRSKSEKILADKFLKNGIPYVYEQPIKLNGFGIVNPDFTLLNTRTRKEYIWEHFGLMDDPEYCVKAIKKMELFQKNGLFQGESLIFTYETAKHPLNMKSVELLIMKYLI